MVDTSLPSFMIDVKVLQIVVKVDASGTEISAQQGSMGGEDGSDVDMTFPTERDGETSLPFVEVGDNGRGEMASGEL